MHHINLEPKNIIVRMPNWIGDLVMATPILTDIRKKFPKSTITAMCQRPICALLEDDRDIDELYCFTKPPNRFFSKREEKKSIIEKLRTGQYDMGILLTNSFSSAWWFWQGKVKNRIGFSRHARRLLLNIPVTYPKNIENEHQVLTYKRLLTPLGIEVSTTKPRLYVDEKSMQEGKELLKHHGYVPGACLIGVNPTASYGDAKRWPADRFRQVIQKLCEKKNCFVVCFAAEESVDLLKKICADLPANVLNLAGLTSLQQLVCAIKLCDVLLTNDSGPMHIAAAVDTPVVALFGSTSAQRTGPYLQDGVIQKKAACSPCYLRSCPIDFRCMKNITVEEVLKEIDRKLDV